MSIVNILLLGAVLGYLLLAFVVIFNDHISKKNQIFSLFLFALSLWLFSSFITHIDNQNIDLSLLLTKLNFFFSLLAEVLLVLFCEELYLNKKRWNLKNIFYFVPILLLFFPLVFSDQIVFGERYIAGEPFYNVGFLVISVFLLALLYLSFITYFLFKAYTTLKGIFLVQVKYVLIGTITSTVIIILIGLVLPLFGFVFLEQWSAIGTIFMVGLMAYAILKHNFLDIRIFLGEIFKYSIIVTFTYFVFYLVLFIDNRFLGGPYEKVTYVVGFLLSIVYIAFLNVILKLISKIGLIQSRESLILIGNKLPDILGNELNITKLSLLVGEYLMKSLRLSMVMILSDSPEKNLKFGNFSKENFDASESDFLTVAKRYKEIINVQEATLLIEREVVPHSAGYLEFIALLKKMEVEIYIPLIKESECYCFLLLGEKASRDGYYVEEMALLKFMADQINIAFQRSLLYRQIQNNNENLKVKVLEATAELKQKNDELQSAYNTAEDTARKERDMLDIMGHELRTPATVIKLATYLLDPTVTDENGKRQVARIKDSIERQIQLINTFINAAKIDNNKMELNLVATHLNDMVKQSVEDHQHEAQEKSLELTFDSEENIPQILADSARMREVIDNLITNAIKYTFQGYVRVSCKYEQNEVVVHVRDSGEGIRETDRTELFQKFKRLNNYTPTSDKTAVKMIRPGGTGLGLYVVKGIIENHKGRIWVDSVYGEGSTFSFAIPVASEEAIKDHPSLANEHANLFKRYNLGKSFAR